MPDFPALDNQGGQLAARWSRATRWAVGIGVVLMVVVGIMLLAITSVSAVYATMQAGRAVGSYGSFPAARAIRSSGHSMTSTAS